MKKYLQQPISKAVCIILAIILCLISGGCKHGTPAPISKDVYASTANNNDIVIHEAEILTGYKGDPITVVQLTDMHFSGIDSVDIEENNPALMSSYENRKWLKDGASVPNGVKCLQYASRFHQTVITGDIMDYLSNGSLSLVKEYIWDPYPTIMAALGNHDASRVCSTDTEDPTSLESRLEILQNNWINDIFYSSKIIDNRVMLIQLDNGSAHKFWEHQKEPLEKDLALAREEGYTVLLFYHIPLCTKNPDDRENQSLNLENPVIHDFCNMGIGNESSDKETLEVYDIIVNNADIIKGCFCGHLHNNYYTEIIAKNHDGTATVIPQYVTKGTPFDGGHVMKITIR